MPNNDFTRKMIAFDTFTIISLCERFGQINCCQRLWKLAQSPINRPIWSFWLLLPFSHSESVEKVKSENHSSEVGGNWIKFWRSKLWQSEFCLIDFHNHLSFGHWCRALFLLILAGLGIEPRPSNKPLDSCWHCYCCEP